MAPSSLTGFFTPRGWGLLCAGTVSLVGAATLGRKDLLALAVLLITLPLLAAAMLRLVKPGFQVERSFAPPLVETGTAATVTLSLRGRASSVSLIREGLPLRFGASPVFRFPPEGGTETGAGTYRYRLRSGRRGLYAIGPVTAEFLDPFGLARTLHTLGGTNQLAVAPAPQELPPAPLAGPAGTDGSAPSRRRGTPSEDDVTTREYRHGDPMRRVHWAATARHGELMVRQEEPVTAPMASIILDQRRPAYGASAMFGAGDADGLVTSESFEWAVSAVISSAVFFAESGYAVGFSDEVFRPGLSRSPSAANPGERLFHGADGLQDLAEGLAALGLAEPAQGSGAATAAAAFGDSLLDGLSTGRSPGPLLVVTGRISAAEAANLAPAARYSTQPMVLMVSDRPAELRPALRILREAGWSAAGTGPGTPVGAAWSLLHVGHTPEPAPAGARGTTRPVRFASSSGAGKDPA